MKKELKVSPRQDMLTQAGAIISGERDVQYGGPEDNFGRIAKIWSVLFGREFTNEDVAMAMVAVKVARYASNSGFQPDTWVDIAGYAACGYEVGLNVQPLR
jgi:hypothetical protein